MGFRVLLLAVKGKSTSDIQAELNVSPTGAHEEIPESPIVGTQLKNGAYLVCICDDIDPNPKLLARLSNGACVTFCYVNETDMNSLTSQYRDGTEGWSVYHDAQVGIDNLQINGSPPVELESIQNRLFAEQRGCTDTDYVFDIPIDLFVTQGGMRYDEDPDSIVDGSEPWEILQRL